MVKNKAFLALTCWFHTVSRKIYNPEAFLNMDWDNDSFYVRARYGHLTFS